MTELAINNADRLSYLAAAVCDKDASQDDLAELDSVLLADGNACRRYLDFCQLHFTLELELRAHWLAQNIHRQINMGSDIPDIPVVSNFAAVNVAAPVSPAPTFPASLLFHPTVGDSSAWTISYLSASIITGLMMLGFWFMPTSRPEQVARTSVPAIAEPKVEHVGRITGMVDCKWNGGSRVSLGQKLDIASGLMEITYNTGAKVILQGPVTYEVEANGGYLAVGKLTGKFDEKAEASALSTIHYPLSTSSNPQSLIPNPFVIRTPTVTVTDLGTEFSVEVRRDETTDVHVVRGAVEAVRNGRTGGVPVRERLVAGEAIRFGPHNVSPQRIAGRPPCVATALSPSKAWREVRDARRSVLLLRPTELVASAYHRVWDANGKLLAENDRQQAFRVATDGIFGRGENDAGPRSSFDTLEAGRSENDFVGLLYGSRMRFDRIKVFLGRQMGDGGNWSEMPRVFILDAPVDTGSAPPEGDSAHWRELRLRPGYGMPFDPEPNANPGAVLEIPLTGFPSGERVGFGWAVGGVHGNGPAGYVSITELRAYGQRLEDKKVGGKEP